MNLWEGNMAEAGLNVSTNPIANYHLWIHYIDG